MNFPSKFYLTLCISFFLFQNFSFSQNSQIGGFTYNWSNYDNSYETGLGEANLIFDSTDMRAIVHAPDIGIHPRIFFGPSEISDIQNRLLTTQSGQAVSAQIHAYTTLLHFGASVYNHNSSYGSDAQGNRWIDNAGFWDSHEYYYKLIAEDSTVWENVPVKRKHMTACIMALEAFECLMHAGEMDDDTQLSYDNRAVDLAKAMNFWASLIVGDAAVNPNTYNEFGGTHMALAYDIHFNSMTSDQQNLVRNGIAQIIPQQPRHGGDMMAFANTSNWSTLNSFEIICNLAIEGEAGYRPELTEKWMRALHNFITYGWYPSGAGYEGLGKNYQFVTTLVAAAKRGYSLLSHPHVRAFGTEFLPAILQPFGYGFTSYDVWGGSGHDEVLGGYKNSPADAVGLKWIFPNDPKIDFVWRNYIEKSVAHNSEGYVYQQIRPDDSYYNYLIPAAVFASDYQNADWNSQAENTISENYFAGDRGLMVVKSETDSNALAMQFHVRQDMGGHTHGDRNDLTISGLGRIWVRKSYGGSQFQPTKFHSCILIDDKGMGVGDPDGDKCRQPASVREYIVMDDLTYAIGDAAYAYTWEWHWSPQSEMNDHPWLGNNDWEVVNETWGDFPYEQNGANYFDLSMYDFPHWHQPEKLERMVKRPYNSMEKLFRTAGMIRTENPFVLIADVAQKDNDEHNYKWLAQMARDLTIEETVVNLQNENYRCDIILKEPADVGNRKFLVRILNNEGYDGSLPPGYLDTLTYEDFFTGNPYNPNPNYVRPRLIVESNSVNPNFKVMMMPFVEGENLPTTNWNETKDTLTVINGMEEIKIKFEETDEGSIRFVLVDESVGQDDLFVKNDFRIFPNPSSDFVWIENKNSRDNFLIHIFNAEGKLLQTLEMNSISDKINVSRYPDGDYYFKILKKINRREVEVLKFSKISN